MGSSLPSYLGKRSLWVVWGVEEAEEAEGVVVLVIRRRCYLRRILTYACRTGGG